MHGEAETTMAVIVTLSVNPTVNTHATNTVPPDPSSNPTVRTYYSGVRMTTIGLAGRTRTFERPYVLPLPFISGAPPLPTREDYCDYL